VSTFPALTRPAFSKMLIGGKPFGYERLYYNFDTHQLQGATLIQKALSTQKEHADYHPKLHFLGFPGYIAYVFPGNFTQNRRVDLSTPLVEAGFRNTDQLEERKDFVLPENGLVSFAAICAANENAPAIAAVLSTIEGVDFSVYRSGVSLLVQGAKGTARISKRQNRFL